MKKTVLFICCLFAITMSYSQNELWGYNIYNDGQIIKLPIDGDNGDVEIVHTFDPGGLLGKYPKGRLLQASNGKLYGISAYAMFPGTEIPAGVLFEYDPVINQYRVLNNTIINGQGGNLYGIIEPVAGWLYGTTDGGRSIFKYNIETEAASIVATIPSFNYNNNPMYPRFDAELMLASDGNLYGVTPMAPSSQNIPYPGGIYKFNMTTGQLTKVFVFGQPGLDIMYPVQGTKLIEGLPGKLYGTAMGGEHVGPQGVAPDGSGTLYEYTIATNTMVKKFDFDYANIGSGPTPLIKSGNKLYGALSGLSVNPQNYPNANGSIFEFDLDTQILTVLHSFTYLADDQVMTPYGPLLKASDGNLYGSSLHGNFRFDTSSNTVTRIVHSPSAATSQSLIEICQKPSYQFFDTAAFMVCENNSFSFDIQNTNATDYVWRKGSTVLPEQTSAILDISDLTLNDTGIYTCTMTNECGSTVTMPLQLTVDECLGSDDITLLKDAVKLYPNPASDVLNLEISDNQNFEVHGIFIINMLGQTVYHTTGNVVSIDISILKSGVYQLLVTTDKGDWNGKFIKD